MDYFLPFTPLTAQKMKISKKWKKNLEMSSFYTIVPKMMIIWYTIPKIWHVTDVMLFLILGYFLHFYPLTCPKNENFKKMKKKHLEISALYTCVPKIMIKWCIVPEKWCVMDRRSDRRKKWHIEVGAPPKKSGLQIRFKTKFSKNG